MEAQHQGQQPRLHLQPYGPVFLTLPLQPQCSATGLKLCQLPGLQMAKASVRFRGAENREPAGQPTLPRLIHFGTFNVQTFHLLGYV